MDNLAKGRQVKNAILLTEAGSAFFSKIGFVHVQRSDAPENIQRSAEFTTLCPDTAKVMAMSLNQHIRFQILSALAPDRTNTVIKKV